MKPMPLIDHIAADKLIHLREARGLSPEGLSLAIKRAAPDAAWRERGAVDAHTIRRIERRGHVPSPRVRFVLAQFFDIEPGEIWAPHNRRLAA
jgi:hypothetical protein